MNELGKLCKVFPGKTPAKAVYANSGDVKIIKFRDVLENGEVDFYNEEVGWVNSAYDDISDLVELLSETILLTNAAHSTEHIGKKVAYVDVVPKVAEKVCFVGELTGIRAKSESLSIKWLSYWLQTIDAKKEIARAIEGAHLIPRQFKRIKLPDFPIEEQNRQIVVLEKVDDAIAKSRFELEKSSSLNLSLIEYLLNSGLNNESNKHKTKAGYIPFNWEADQLRNLVEIDSGIALGLERRASSNPCKYLTVINIKRGCISFDPIRYLELTPEERPKRLLSEDNILVVEGHANPYEIGRSAIVGKLEEEVTFQNHLFRLTANKQRIMPKFLVYVLNCRRVQQYWNSICNTSSGLNTINRRNLRNLWIQLPSIDQQEKIIEIFNHSELNLNSIKYKLSKMESLKKSLLHNLLTGKIRLPPEAIDGDAGEIAKT